MEIGGSQTSQLGGPMVQGQFVVRNSGPSRIPNLQLTILWPSRTDPDEIFFIYPSMITTDSPDVSNIPSSPILDSINSTSICALMVYRKCLLLVPSYVGS